MNDIKINMSRATIIKKISFHVLKIVVRVSTFIISTTLNII